ncbi:hypothetical protein AsFPU1_1335 [Aphanothece sacrum FPU1]|uniref:Uncharacterized protein n=1 Tax=Aphanothece sacrum FPU1 TaxID=1920663 RepID=A0A401IF79_APHSA|nr:hypothetical protein AsFPU1_1335 [Aphanothece sacrum FPU1]GBF83845.1 hypothetical protein AsFPU3_0889 [Aphanothece sacrum FPU3]
MKYVVRRGGFLTKFPDAHKKVRSTRPKRLTTNYLLSAKFFLIARGLPSKYSGIGASIKDRIVGARSRT